MTASQSPRSNPRRPSLSIPKPMSWLGGSKSSASSPIAISEPKLIHDMFNAGNAGSCSAANVPARYGPLGAGATVVRTPQDALSASMRSRAILITRQQRPLGPLRDSDTSSYDENEPPSPTSPPLPPLPLSCKSTPELNIPDATNANLVPLPLRFPSHPALQIPRSKIFIPPSSIPECPPQASFVPILLSPSPDVLLNLPTLMVTLDTSTSSLRTTYSTLTSRPSHLADYLSAIVRNARERKFCDVLAEAVDEGEQQEEEDAQTVPPPDTPFASLFTAHFNSVPQSPQSLHLFLDRPSAPYTHVLMYLRSPTTTSSILPRSVSLGYSFTRERFDALLELRDEAKYLGLEELYQLCCDELRQAQVHARVSISSSIHSTHTNSSSSHNNNNSNNSNSKTTSSTLHNLIMPGSFDRGRTPGMMHILREHQFTNSKLPHIVGHERDSGSSSLAVSHVAQIVEPSPSSPISSPARSRSRGDQPRSAEGWI